MARTRWALAGVFLIPATAAAQQQQQPATWAQLPRMQLERQFAGPLQDTVIQRWRDPVDGMICYIYLPITAQHSPPGPAGFVQYGANIIGSISCVTPATPAAPNAAPAQSSTQKKTAPAPRPASPNP